MIGQNLDVERISRVVVLVEYDDGRQAGWSVTEPEVVRWEYAGMHDTQGTKGEMLVRGVFHRKARDLHIEVDLASIPQGEDGLEIEP